MGDAGTPVPTLGGEDHDGGQQPEQKEVNVLVTGFGPFKTFTHNPSHLITQHLSSVLHLDDPDPTPLPGGQIALALKINLQIYRQPLRVSYPTIAQTIPPLLHPIHPPLNPDPDPEPDYVLHLGMADGRKYYALETLAHRDGYTILDIDGADGLECGSWRWTEQGCPSVLEVEWDRDDVLRRWNEGLKQQQQQQQHRRMMMMTMPTGFGRVEGEGSAASTAVRSPPDLRLSSDAGRFVCDFIFYASLSERWKEDQEQKPQRSDQQPLADSYLPYRDEGNNNRGTGRESLGCESRKGKVAFLHVPGDTHPTAIERGVLVTEAAIRALVGSWEDGARRRWKKGGC